MSVFREQACVFSCGGRDLVGVLSRPADPAPVGVVIVVGGPQYRAGSHRQFTLLARSLAAAGYPVLRFDYRGMGDSDGPLQTFEDAQPDISASIDRLLTMAPEVREVVLWGLCDAASAALMYAYRDPRVAGLVLANPWVRTEAGQARTQLRHYYLRRLCDRDFWLQVVRGRFRVGASAAALARNISAVVRSALDTGRAQRGSGSSGTPELDRSMPLPERMAEGLRRFRGRVLLILSGNDLTAQEFRDAVARSSGWQELLGATRVEVQEFPEANHTFGKAQWRAQVEAWTARWLRDGTSFRQDHETPRSVAA